jgi:Tripartite tricarboxylate transporter TctB family
MAAVNKRDLGAGLFVLGIGVAFLLWSQTYPPRMSAMPKLVGWVTIVLSLIDIAAQFDTPLGRMLRRIAGLEIAGRGSQTENSADAPWRLLIAAVLWVVGYIAGIYLVGFLAATPIYIFLYMALHGRKPKRVSALTAIVATAAIWFTFEYLFHYPLYPGWLFGGQ